MASFSGLLILPFSVWPFKVKESQQSSIVVNENFMKVLFFVLIVFLGILKFKRKYQVQVQRAEDQRLFKFKRKYQDQACLDEGEVQTPWIDFTGR